VKSFRQFIKEMPNSGPSTPVKYYKDGDKILPYFGGTRIGKIRLKKGKV